MNKTPRFFVLCSPHFGTLDNWLPIVNSLNNKASSLNFTLIIPDADIVKSFHKNNAVVQIANNIFDTVLTHVYNDKYVQHASLFDSIEWYENNNIILRLLDIFKKFVKRPLLSFLPSLPITLLCNIIYKKECNVGYREFGRSVSKMDILLYDIHAEGIYTVLNLLQLFKNNKKYSLPHALSMLNTKGMLPARFNIRNNNVQIYVYAEFQKKYYNMKYKADIDKIRVVGIPRHDHKWIKTIQKESDKLPDDFNNNNTIVILSRHASSAHLLFDEKAESVKNIKKIFVDKLGMRLAIKLHPNEKQGKTYINKKENIYEDILGRDNYGLTWVYSDLHVFALAKEKRLAISFNTGVVFDLIAMGIPCVEYIDSIIKNNNSEKKMTQFSKHKFIERVSSYSDLCIYVDKWLNNPNQISELSINTYEKYFPIFDNSSEEVASEILHDNKIAM